MWLTCSQEKIKIDPDALLELITGCNQDIRQVLHHLSLLKGDEKTSSEKMSKEEAKKEVERCKKTSIKIVRVNECVENKTLPFKGPFDVVRKVFSSGEQKEMSLMDKSDLFFHDYSLSPLFNQEMYLHVEPKTAR